MSRCFQTYLALTVCFFLVITNATARRLIPDDNLAYPVLITLKSGGRTVGSGSGVYLDASESGFYLVTAKHVIEAGLPDPAAGKIEMSDLVIELLSYSKDVPASRRYVLSLDFRALRENGDVKAHKFRDVAVIKIGTPFKQPDGSRRIAFQPGVTPLESADGIVSASLDAIREFDEVLVGNDAILYGYPASLGLPNTHQFDPLRPLLRKALIAGQDQGEP